MSLQRNETIVVRRHRPFNNSQVQSTEEDRKRWKEKTHRTEEPSQKTKRKKNCSGQLLPIQFERQKRNREDMKDEENVIKDPPPHVIPTESYFTPLFFFVLFF